MPTEFKMPKIELNTNFLQECGIPEEMGKEALNTRTRLVGELNQGRGAEGVPLRPYSPGYAKFKAASGRSGTLVNLLWSGELHRSIQVQPPQSLDGEGTVEFQGGHKGGFANAGLAQSLYDRGFTGWFQWGRQDIDRMEKTVTAAIDKNISKIVDIK